MLSNNKASPVNIITWLLKCATAWHGHSQGFNSNHNADTTEDIWGQVHQNPSSSARSLLTQGILWPWNNWKPWHRCTHTPCQGRLANRCSSKSPDSWHRTWCCRTVWCRPCSCKPPGQGTAYTLHILFWILPSYAILILMNELQFWWMSCKLVFLIWMSLSFPSQSFAILGRIGWQRTKGLR